ncbi:MAG: IS91 family transposase [Terriglobia bacterium]
MVAPAGRARLEVADILRAHGAAYQARHPLSPEQATVMRRLVACRTAALGGHVDACDACGFTQVSYNSCRDRHCPKCQATKRAEWVQRRLQRLLPVEYFHVVFTLPEPLKPLALKNRRLVYELLFRAASETLLELAADPKRLGAQVGLTAVLHTWGQNLLFHPHLHCVVTGGGLSPDGRRWVAARQGYLLPVKVLSKLFRGKFLAGLKDAYQSAELKLTGSVAPLAEPRRFAELLDRLYRQDWVVYAKPPFGGAEQVYRYLGRYTHRVAIANARLVSMHGAEVRFRYKDYADGNTWKILQLSAEEFIRRFLLHVLPKRFVRIRHYGLLAGRNVCTKLPRAGQLLGLPTPPEPAEQPCTAPEALPPETASEDPPSCPLCQAPLRRTRFEAFVAAPPDAPRRPPLVRPVALFDSS